jgi:hypothetical protein
MKIAKESYEPSKNEFDDIITGLYNRIGQELLVLIAKWLKY